MKQEIEHIQHVIEKDRLQMLKDFDEWWEERSEEAVCHIKLLSFLLQFLFIGTTTANIRNEPIKNKWEFIKTNNRIGNKFFF
jgi:hypothetical protein